MRTSGAASPGKLSHICCALTFISAVVVASMSVGDVKHLRHAAAHLVGLHSDKHVALARDLASTATRCRAGGRRLSFASIALLGEDCLQESSDAGLSIRLGLYFKIINIEIHLI